MMFCFTIYLLIIYNISGAIKHVKQVLDRCNKALCLLPDIILSHCYDNDIKEQHADEIIF